MFLSLRDTKFNTVHDSKKSVFIFSLGAPYFNDFYDVLQCCKALFFSDQVHLKNKKK